MSKPLTPRQAKFVAGYIKHGVAERAALDAGYSKATARSMAQRLLANAGIRAEIDRLAKATEAENVADLAELRAFWSATMRSRDHGMRDRLRASESLGKSLGAFIERHVVEPSRLLPASVAEYLPADAVQALAERGIILPSIADFV